MQKVGFLGPHGTFSHECALKVSPQSTMVPIEGNFSEILSDASRKGCDGAVLPFLNSSGVQVRPVQKAVFDSAGKWWVVGALGLPVILNFVVTENFKKAKEIISKAEVFPQCEQWLTSNAKRAKRIEAVSTAAALVQLLESPPEVQRNTAAICNELATTLYGGITAHRAIQAPNNQTVFLILSTTRPSFSERMLITIDCPNRGCYENTVDRLASRLCPMKFSSLIGDFSPEAPTFVEIEVANSVRHEDLIESECGKPDSVVKFVGTYSASKSISNCVSDLFV